MLATSSVNIVYYLLLVVSPAVMILVLLKISTPLLEKSMANFSGYREYKQRTPKIFPFTKKG